MAKFLSDRQQSLRVGISSYTENNTVLQTIGKVGIGTTNSGGRSLYVIGDAEVTGILSATAFYGSGANLTDLIGAKIGGLDIKNEGVSIGSSFSTINLIGDYVTATGIGSVADITFSSPANIQGGDAGDIPYQSATDTTTFLDASTASVGQVILWNGTVPYWGNVSAASGAFGGISVQDESIPVGTSGSITTLNFRGTNVVATATTGPSGIATITIADNLVGTALSISGISTFTQISVGGTTGPNTYVLSSTGTGLSWQSVTSVGGGTLNGIIVQEEGVTVGSAGSITTLNFVGNNITASAVALGVTATITLSNTPTFDSLVVTGITTSADFNSTSDINLKKDIIKIENPLETIDQLNGVKFTWKSNDKKSIGVIAQEVEKVLPELVSQSETKTVNYNGIVGVLIEAVKELSAEVRELKSQLNN